MLLHPRTFRRVPVVVSLPVLVLLTFVLSRFYSHGPSLFAPVRRGRPNDAAAIKDDPNRAQCIPEVEALRQVSPPLNRQVTFSRRCIRTSFSKTLDRRHIANISSPFIEQQTAIDLNRCDSIGSVPCDDITLEVPYPYPDKKFTDYAFGIATSYGRLEESLGPFAHWLGNTGAKLVGIVTDKGDHDLKRMEKLYADAGVDASFVFPRNSKWVVEDSHFGVILDLLEKGSNNLKWLGLLDDDTFLPSLFALDRQFSKYDPEEQFWIGNLSDDFLAVKRFGFMSYGGAGVFLSIGLARFLEPRIEQCVKEAGLRTGDGEIRDCIYTHTDTKLTMETELHQFDLQGDLGGVYERGHLPLTLHHWKSWHHVPVVKMASVTKFCGDCFLQRWRFGDDTVFTNGYSIASYADGVAQLDLSKTEGTWNHAFNGDFTFSLGPLRPKIEQGKKKTYKIEEAAFMPDGSFRQLYVYRTDQTLGGSDAVVEVIWKS